MNQRISEKLIIQASDVGKRLDVVLALSFPQYSRSLLQDWIEQGAVSVDGVSAKKKLKVEEGQSIVIDALLQETTHWEAVSAVSQDCDYRIVYEDEDLLVIDKPAGLVVHPAAGNTDNTLINGLLADYPSLAQLPRAGLVHRLDKDTTGLLVVARTVAAHTELVRKLQLHEINREYQAVVNGVMIAGGRVDAPLARHPRNRQKRAVVSSGKEALTHYRVISRFSRQTHLSLRLETGRTHQIRVHLAHIGFPIVGDKIYGMRGNLLPKHADEALISALQQFPRQALHAYRLSFMHPITEEEIDCISPLPQDMQLLVDLLTEHEGKNKC